MSEKRYCPKCGSEEVFTTHEQAFMVNTGDHYCHMVKTQDDDSKAGCLICNWRGERRQLKCGCERDVWKHLSYSIN